MTIRADDVPTFNLKAVVQETGLKPDTLRAWERRYGLPSPERSSGRHRLYSPRDIEIVKWLIARQEEGLTISRAVDLWKKIKSEGNDPLVALATTAPTSVAAAAGQFKGSKLDEFIDGWLKACLEFDEIVAEGILTQAFALYPPEVVALELIRPALVEIGERWHSGDVTAQQEHFASALAMRRLDALVAASPPPTRQARILVGCPPEESHTFSPLLLTFLLRRQGWQTIFLGANVPLTRLELTITQAQPNLVILAAQLLATAATLLDMAQLLQEQRIPLAFGGLVFGNIPDLAARIPGHYLGNSLDEAPALVEKLLASPQPAPSPSPAPAAYAETLKHFNEQRPLIGARVWQLIKPNGGPISPAYLSIANTHIGQNISAALKLGDMSFLGSDMDWIESLLAERNLPPQALGVYMRTYAQAASEQLDHRGAPVLNWLDKTIAEQF